MARIQRSVEIERSPEEVFAYVDDLEAHPEWQTGLLKAEKVTGGLTGVGTRSRELRRIMGRQMRIEYEVTEHEPPRLAAFRSLNGPLRPFGRMTLAPSARGTRVTFELDFEASGLGVLIRPLARRDAGRQVQQDLETLRAVLENPARPPAGGVG
jgi:uncharacterized membrane protein